MSNNIEFCVGSIFPDELSENSVAIDSCLNVGSMFKSPHKDDVFSASEVLVGFSVDIRQYFDVYLVATLL